MARPLVSLTLALATATLLFLSMGATPASAQQSTPPAAPKPNQLVPELVDAVQLLREGKISEAIKKLEDTSRKYPAYPSAHVMAYQFLAQLNQPDLARLELDKAIKADPSDPEPYVVLGNIALQERRMPEAAIDFEKAEQLLAVYAKAERKVAKEILDYQTKSGLARVAESHEDWKEAEAHLRDLLKLAPEDLLAQQRLARALFQQSKAADAYNVLLAARQIDRDNARKYNTKEVVLTPEAILAQYYDQYEGPTSKTGNAGTWFKEALKKAPDDLPTRRAVANWALERGDIAFAKEQAKAALRIESDPKYSAKYRGSKLGHELSGLVALWEKDWPEAEKNFDANNRVDPNDVGNRNNLALALVEQKDQEKQKRALHLAEENYNEVTKSPDTLKPEILALKPEVLSTLAWVYFRRGEVEDALRVIMAVNSAGGLANANADTLTYAAHILRESKLDWNAKVLLEGILKSDRAFSMRPEALKLYEQVKDAKKPEASPAAKTR